MEFDSTWQWLTWIIMVPIFFVYRHYMEILKDHLYPCIVTDRGRRQVFDLLSIAGGLFAFLMAWGLVLELIYN